MATNYKKGDLVWAKMKGYPFWPGRIAKPLKEMKKPSKSNMQCVYFFGTKNYSYIELNNLRDYKSHKLQFEKATKSHSFRSALDDLEKTLKGENDSIDDHEEEDDGPFDLQVVATSTPKNVKKTKTVGQSKKRRSAGENDENNLSNKVTTKKEEESNLDMGTKYKKRKTDKLTNSSSTYGKNGSFQSYLSPHSYNMRKMSKRKVIAPVDLINISEGLSAKRIQPSQLTIGFIGLGVIGSRLLKNLLHSKHKVTIWNRTEQKCQSFEEIGARVASTPYDLVKIADIIFLCVENENAVIDILFATALTFGIEDGSKSFVNLTPISAEVSEHISDILHAYNCKYLSVNFVGTHEYANNAQLKAIVAGDDSVIEEAQSCLQALTGVSYNTGKDLTKMYLMNFMVHTYVSKINRSLVESMGIAKKANASISQSINLAFVYPQLIHSFFQLSLKHYQKFGVLLEIAPPNEVLRGPNNIDITEESNIISGSLFRKQCEIQLN